MNNYSDFLIYIAWVKNDFYAKVKIAGANDHYLPGFGKQPYKHGIYYPLITVFAIPVILGSRLS